jgi:signal transduction histidine kinase
MPFIKKICQQLNFIAQCKKYNLTLWQCPSFLFPLTGLITILAMLGTYSIAAKYAEPEIVALIVIGVATILIIIGYLIIQGFEQLAQANQMKSEFVSIVSHQLRTPLTGIKWMINLMMRNQDQAKDLSKEQLERLASIKENNQRMIDLVNDLLDVSRIEQGRLGLRPEKLSLKEIIEKIIKEYTPLAQASNIKLSLKLEPNLPLIAIDRRGIELVLDNLIDNAIRYTKGGGEVIISLMRKNGLIRCEIQDNGVGIPAEDQKKIFQKFFRSQNVLKYQTEGTGLGLFIAKAMIKASGGKMGFWSKEKKGSVFWFELPIK